MDKMSLTWTLIAQWIMFLAAMGILSKFLFKPMMAVFEKRKKATDGPKREAEELKTDAAAAQEQVAEGIRAARGEASKLRAALVDEATVSERDIVAEARTKAAEQIEQARAELDREVQQAKQQLERDAEQLADQLAGALLKG